jgi:myo-inositol 2-dehydrogenase / D-chiro-inositol 1-dehydrogenase
MVSKAQPVGIGLIGCGEVTEHKHLPVLRRIPDAKVVAVADIDQTRARRVANRYCIPHVYADIGSLLAHPTLEAIGVCVPPRFHVEVAMSALEAGKHILIEKPLALDLDESDKLIQRAQDYPNKIMVGFHMRWHTLVRQARQIIQSGFLGPLETIRAVWNSPRADLHLPGWRQSRAAGGGALIEIAVHHFDLWRYLLQSEIEQIFALSRAGKREDETAVVSARMENGVVVSAVFSKRTSHEIELEVCGREGRLKISCLRFEGLELYSMQDVPGSIRTRLKRLVHLLQELPRGLSKMCRGGDYLDSYRSQWCHFVHSIQNDAPVECTLEDGRQALQAALASVESASRQQPVTVRQSSRRITPGAF